MLPQQIQQCRFQGGYGMDCCPQIKGLIATPAPVETGELLPHPAEEVLIVSQLPMYQEGPGILESLANALAARHFAHSGMSRVIFQDDQITSEEWTVRPAEVQQHAVGP